MRGERDVSLSVCLILWKVVDSCVDSQDKTGIIECLKGCINFVLSDRRESTLPKYTRELGFKSGTPGWETSALLLKLSGLNECL